jgi:hypothetical protein
MQNALAKFNLRDIANRLLSRDDTVFAAQEEYKRYAIEAAEAGERPLPFREWLAQRRAQPQESVQPPVDFFKR